MSKRTKCEISSHTCLYIVTDNMAKTKKTLWKEEKMYWEWYGFDDKLKKILKWKDSKYEAYNTFMAKQKNLNSQLEGRLCGKSFWEQLLEKLPLPLLKHHKRSKDITLEQWHLGKSDDIRRALNYLFESCPSTVW